MKKIIIYAIAILMAINFVSAGCLTYTNKFGIETYYCYSDINADRLQGYSYQEIISQIPEPQEYPGGGMSKNDLSFYLLGFREVFKEFDTILDYLKEIFALRSELNEINERLDRIEAFLTAHSTFDIFQDKAVAIVKTTENQQCYTYKNYSCCHDRACVKSIE